ncbi:hypothetical protein [Paractinoplanes maris]|uniref:hypothetical protein n=1 Tax=Paractinoplanes maris TaxID=1734446 RepID=UPI0020229AB2|nr:hypothetical protein [Actinoplanes maris]
MGSTPARSVGTTASSTPETSSPPPSPPSPGPTSPRPGPTSPPAASGTTLADLTPLAGGSNLQRVPGTTTFRLPCASNTDGDLYRAVKFAVPRRDATGLSARVRPDGIGDDVEVTVRIDNLEGERVQLRPGQESSALSTPLVGGGTLELRLTCNKPGGAVTFSDAVLTK